MSLPTPEYVASVRACLAHQHGLVLDEVAEREYLARCEGAELSARHVADVVAAHMRAVRARGPFKLFEHPRVHALATFEEARLEAEFLHADTGSAVRVQDRDGNFVYSSKGPGEVARLIAARSAVQAS